MQNVLRIENIGCDVQMIWFASAVEEGTPAQVMSKIGQDLLLTDALSSGDMDGSTMFCAIGTHAKIIEMTHSKHYLVTVRRRAKGRSWLSAKTFKKPAAL